MDSHGQGVVYLWDQERCYLGHIQKRKTFWVAFRNIYWQFLEKYCFQNIEKLVQEMLNAQRNLRCH